MRHSIKTKLILVLTTVITLALLLGGGTIIWQNVRDMQREIFLNALTFGDLTNDRIVTSFEQFYETENFLQFRKDVNPLLYKNGDIKDIEVIGKSGELFYRSSDEKDVAYIGEQRKNSYEIDRARDIKASLKFSSGEIVFAKKTDQNEWLPVTRDELVLPDFPQGEVLTIVFPHKNARLSLVYTLSYGALWARIYRMMISIAVVIGASLVVVSILGVALAGKFVQPIKALENVVVRVGQGELGAQVKIDTGDEINVLGDTFNQMSVKLKKDTEELLIKEALEKELNIAREIQENMLPKKAPDVPGLDLAGYLTPAATIGGDIYDYFLIDKKGAYIFIADVTGHGVPAAMIANITHSTLYSFAQVYEKTDEIMKAMNTVIHAKTKRNMFATALLAHWDEGKHRMNYCNAGHEQIVYYDASKKEVSLHGKGGMPLGMIANLSPLLKENSIEMHSGDVLLFYTDGIPEAWRTEKENLGMERLEEMTKKAVSDNKDANSIRDAVLKSVTKFRNNYPQQDDITLVVIRAK